MKDIKLFDLLKTAIGAGEKIIDIYNTDFTAEIKADNSPLTEADKQAHLHICDHLQKTYPSTPILSEEGKHTPYEKRKKWSSFWLIDPLDGTKEFIKKNGEFTVNIALIENSLPTLGIIYIPVKETLYFAAKNLGAHLLINAKQVLEANKSLTTEQIINLSQRLPKETHPRPYTVVASRSHMSKETQEYIDTLKETHPDLTTINSGSSLKFCLVADGSADTYPRFGPTSEWDTGAAQAIISESGKDVIDYETKTTMKYNKENLRNNYFIVK